MLLHPLLKPPNLQVWSILPDTISILGISLKSGLWQISGLAKRLRRLAEFS
jgi:hypothetical protein